LIATDGNVLNTGHLEEDGTLTSNSIRGSGSHLQIRSRDRLGSELNPLLTKVDSLNVSTASHGVGKGDLFVRETDSLSLVTEKSYTSTLNAAQIPDLIFRSVLAETHWENSVAWLTNPLAADWKTRLTTANSVEAIELGRGQINFDLVGANSTLSLTSGRLRAKSSAADITLISDDFDFLSGAGQLVGTGKLRLASHQLVLTTRLGSAADSGLNSGEIPATGASRIANPGTYLSRRDMAALADGYTSVTIGRRDQGNRLIIGDLMNSAGVDSRLRDLTTLLSDRIEIVGAVQAPQNTLTLETRLFDVAATNIHMAEQSVEERLSIASGIVAPALTLSIDEQSEISGYLRAASSITLTTPNTPQSDADLPTTRAIYSLGLTTTGMISTTDANSTIAIEGKHGFNLAGVIQAGVSTAGVATTGGTVRLNAGKLALLSSRIQAGKEVNLTVAAMEGEPELSANFGTWGVISTANAQMVTTDAASSIQVQTDHSLEWLGTLRAQGSGASVAITTLEQALVSGSIEVIGAGGSVDLAITPEVEPPSAVASGRLHRLQLNSTGSIKATGATTSINVSARHLLDLRGVIEAEGTDSSVTLWAGDQALLVGSARVEANQSLSLSVGSSAATSSGLAVAPYGGLSLQTDALSILRTTDANSYLMVSVAQGLESRGVIEAIGAGAGIDIHADGALLLVEGSDVRALDATASVALSSADVLAVNAGSAVRAGVRFASDGITPQISGADAFLSLQSSGEMLLGGSVSSSGSLFITSGSQKYDNAAYGNPTNTGTSSTSYQPRYNIYNKTANLASIATVSPTHYLVPHTAGYGLMVTGTVTSLGADQQLSLSSGDDFLVRGNINALGAGSSLTLQSDKWLYVEGFLTATAALSLAASSADTRGTSIYVHPTSTVRTSEAGSSISIFGAQDVDLLAGIVAGGTIGASGVLFATDSHGDGGSEITVEAGQQLRVESGLLASGDLTLRSGVPGTDDGWNGRVLGGSTNPLSLLINSSGGLTAAGLGKGTNADGSRKGSTLSIVAKGRVELMGWVNSGGQLQQTFDSQGNLLQQTVVWSGRDSDLAIESTGRVYVGGTTINQAGSTIMTGGYLNASRLLQVKGGVDSEGSGLVVHAAAELVVAGTRNADGTVRSAGAIDISGVNDVDMQGLLVAGGRSEMVRDTAGKYLGRRVVRYDVDSTVRVQADRQLIIGTDIQAGQSVTLIGGLDTRTVSTGSPYTGRGLVLYGSAGISTSRPNGLIDLNAPGRIDLLAPGDVQELVFDGWPLLASGQLSRDVTVVVRVDLVTCVIEAAVTIAASATTTNTTISDLVTDFNNALRAATWSVLSNNGASTSPAVGSSYTTFTNQVEAKLRDGRLRLASGYGHQVLQTGSIASRTSTNSSDLGLSFTASITSYSSGRRYALDASGVGSRIRIGKSGGPNGKLYIAGKVRAYAGLDLYSGRSSDGRDIDLDATGVLETMQGSIAFNAGESGLLKGDVIAGGSGSDVVISSGRSLTLQGTVQAADRVVLKGGDGTVIGDFTSLTLSSTAKVISTDGTGEISLGGTNNVFLDGQVISTTSTVPITLESTAGVLTLNKLGGSVTAVGQLTIHGRDVLLNGPITSTLATPAGASSSQLTITADRHGWLNNSLTATGKVSVNIGSNLSAIDSTWTAPAINLSVGGSATFGNPVSAATDSLQHGATFTAQTALQVLANSLQLNKAAVLSTTAALSTLSVTVGSGVVVGDVTSAGSLQFTATESLEMGYTAPTGDTTSVSRGGVLSATGNVSVAVGKGSLVAPTGLVVDRRSLIRSTGSTGQVAIAADRNARIDGTVTANQVTIDTGRNLQLDGLITGKASVAITTGKTDSSGVSLTTGAVVYQMSGSYFVDENGKLMNADGKLVNSSGQFVNASNVVVTTPVDGGAPVYLRGSIIDSGAAGQPGTITIAAAGRQQLDGTIGQVTLDANRSPQVLTGTVTITGSSTEQTHLYADINAASTISLNTGELALRSDTLLRTWGDQGTITINASGNVLMEGAVGSDQAARLVSSKAITMAGRQLWLEGIINSVNTINLTSTADLVLTASGNVGANMLGGRDGTNVAITASSGANLYVWGSGVYKTAGALNLTAVQDVSLAAGSSGAATGARLVSIPIISTESVTRDVITGYTQVAAGTIQVPVIEYVSTTVTEQDGTESVKTGYSFNTMDVSLVQDGYWNSSTSTQREFFVEGVDYRNSSSTAGSAPVIPWNTSVPAPSNVDGYAATFADLTDTQRDLVLATLGYKKLYNFNPDNLQTNRVVNGNTTRAAWTPDWKTAAVAPVDSRTGLLDRKIGLTSSVVNTSVALNNITAVVDDFSSGWSRTGSGGVLGPFSTETSGIDSEKTFTINNQRTQIYFQFQARDSWDWEAFTIYLNGVSKATLNPKNSSGISTEEVHVVNGGVDFRFVPRNNWKDMYESTAFKDQVWDVLIEIPQDYGQTLKIGLIMPLIKASWMRVTPLPSSPCCPW